MKFISNFLKQFRRQDEKNYLNIISAKVVEIYKHPNADRLRLIKLDTGKTTIDPVVCGAFNFQVGDIVALALPDSKILQNIHNPQSGGFVLKKTIIRGVESQGMICAGFELGLSNSPEQGIMLLKKDTELGRQFSPKMIK